jgi:hypothetical protein
MLDSGTFQAQAQIGVQFQRHVESRQLRGFVELDARDVMDGIAACRDQLEISEKRTAPLSSVSRAQRGLLPHARIAKQAARISGLYTSSNGQLIKTERSRLGWHLDLA